MQDFRRQFAKISIAVSIDPRELVYKQNGRKRRLIESEKARVVSEVLT